MFKFVMTKNSNEIFHRAILSNDVARTKLILEEAMKDPRFNIDEINEEGLTALQFSCFAGNLEIVKILVSHSASYKIRDRDGNSLLHAAALAGTAEVLKYLIRIGLKPTVRNDEGLMPIDVTDEVCAIVILLRAMLDQGYLEEMQEYMLDHPKLKRNIFKELERVKCRENEKNEILKDMPYSSHTSPRRQSATRMDKPKDNKSRSLSTFSKLSDSMLHLDQLLSQQLPPPPPPQRNSEDRNNNYNNHHRHSVDFSTTQHAPSSPSLKRHNSTSSTSSHGSRSSRGSTGGILRNTESAPAGDYEARHRNTQQYLESRFPPPSSPGTKSVSFDLDRVNHRNYSDGYISDSYEEKLQLQNNRPLSRSSSISSHSSSQTGVFSDTCSNYAEEEQLYANMQSLKPTTTNLPTINENLYENLPLKTTKFAPPLPPRIPQHRETIASSRNSFESSSVENYPPYPTSIDRQFGSETDSGIDINETAGRVFALSLDDQNVGDAYDNYSAQSIQQQQQQNSSSYSRPIGIFYSQQMQATTVRQESELDNPGTFVRPTAIALNPKYRSWNGRTLLESQLQKEPELAPYASHGTGRRRNQSRDDSHVYNNRNRYDIDQYNYQQPQSNGYYQKDADIPLRQFNFDHQPEIML